MSVEVRMAVFWILLLSIAALGAIALAYLALAHARRDPMLPGDLRRRFDSEYDRAVEETGSGRAARRELRRRIRRVSRLPLRALDSEERARFRDAWEQVERGFVDDPSRAVGACGQLLEQIVRALGYPFESLAGAAADLSVHHAAVIPQLRSAGKLAKTARAGRASPDELRRALVCYRALVEELLAEPTTQGASPDQATAAV